MNSTWNHKQPIFDIKIWSPTETILKYLEDLEVLSPFFFPGKSVVALAVPVECRARDFEVGLRATARANEVHHCDLGAPAGRRSDVFRWKKHTQCIFHTYIHIYSVYIYILSMYNKKSYYIIIYTVYWSINVLNCVDLLYDQLALLLKEEAKNEMLGWWCLISENHFKDKNNSVCRYSIWTKNPLPSKSESSNMPISSISVFPPCLRQCLQIAKIQDKALHAVLVTATSHVAKKNTS